MGICAECKYYEEIEREFQAVLPEYPVNEKSLINKTVVSNMHYDKKEIIGVCNNPKHIKTDFISGESVEKDAELFNEFGQCELFVEKDGEDPSDVPAYPVFQIVLPKTEIETEEELEVKCYVDANKMSKISYKWYVGDEEVEDEDSYSLKFTSEEAGDFTIKCEVTNTDSSCKDRTTSTSYKEVTVTVVEPEEEDTDDTEDTGDTTETPSENTTEETTQPEGTSGDNESDYF